MSKVSIKSKLPAVGTSIFTVMSALAREHGALNLSQGFPDFPADPALAELVTIAMGDGYNQYAPSAGWMPLREEIASLVYDLYSANYNPESEITVTSGATEALYCAITAVIKEGDEVIVFEPSYDSYVPVIELNGGIPIYEQLTFPDYKINWENVKKRVNSSTRMIILNTPHNPTGAVLTAQDMEELKKIVFENQIVVLADEVYEHMIYDGLEHQSVSRYPGLAEQSFVVSSFGKTFHATGWKIGYCVAPEYLMREFRKVHQFVNFSSSTPFQVAIASYMRDYRYMVTGLSTFYQAKRDYFLQLIIGSRFKPIPSSGTYFQLLTYDKVSDEKDVDFARRMTIEHKLASIPVSVFYHGGEDNHALRFCFAKEPGTLEIAAQILNSL
jgi:methionine aminotransferase